MTIEDYKRLAGLEEILRLLHEEEVIRLLRRATIRHKFCAFEVLQSLLPTS